MKDEEMAEEYLKEKLEERKDKFIFELPEVYITDVKQAFLAGLKAGRPQWHDLREANNCQKEGGGEMTKRQKEFYDYLQKLKAYDNPKFIETALREFFKYWEMYEKRGCKDSMTLAMESTEAFVGLPIVAKPCEV